MKASLLCWPVQSVCWVWMGLFHKGPVDAVLLGMVEAAVCSVVATVAVA
jgi:hypothetical protein